MSKVYRIALPVIGGLMALFQCGCSTLVDKVSDWFRGEQVIDSSVVATWWDGPRVRPGIGLIVQVGSVGVTPVSMTVMVDQNGAITLPLLLDEPVKCDGMTLEELKKTLVAAYGKYYRQPMVTVTFAPYDGNGVSPWGTITVLGKVGSPGPVNMPATMDMTVTKVLQVAGGYSTFADTSSIVVMRCDKDGRQTRIKVNVDEIGKDGRIDKDIPLRAGDVVWVPEVWF